MLFVLLTSCKNTQKSGKRKTFGKINKKSASDCREKAINDRLGFIMVPYGGIC